MGGSDKTFLLPEILEGRGEGKCAGQQMLWQEKGNELELKPTSGQKSFCSSQLGWSHRRSPTLSYPPQACGAAQLRPGMGDPSRPEMTTHNPPFPSWPDEPELPEANSCLCLCCLKANLKVSGRPRHILAPKILTAAATDVQNLSQRSFFGWVSGPTATWTTIRLRGEAQPCPQG